MTKLLAEHELKAGAQIIRDGGTVAFRTETVYGLGADATSETAVAKIFEAKGRPAVNPLIVHFASLEDVFSFFPDVDAQTRRVLELAKSALTVILPRPKRIPAITSGGLDTVAVRVPACKFACSFIRACGVPIAAPSANTSTRPSPTRWQDVYEDLNGHIDAIFKGKQTRIGLESTVVRVNKNIIEVLRLGGTCTEELAKITGMPVELITNKEHAKSSPGTAFKHYAPSCPLVISQEPNMVKKIKEYISDKDAVVLCMEQNKKCYQTKTQRVISLGSTAKQISKNLFAAIREAEKISDAIACETFPNSPEFEAVNERIRRASSWELK